MAFIGAMSGQQNSNSSTSTLFGAGNGISGLASGIDTDSIVKGLMQAAQQPLISILQQRQVLEWQQQQYQQVNTALASLQSSVGNIKLQSTFMAQAVSSSNTSVATGSAGAFSAPGAYQLSVYQMASSATVSSSSSLSTDPAYGSTALADLGYSSGISLTVNNASYTFQPTDTLDSVLSTISHDPASGVTAFYDSNSGKVVMQTTTTGTGAKIQLSGNTNFITNVLKFSAPSNQIWDASSNVDSSTGVDLLKAGGLIELNGVRFTLQTGQALTDVTNTLNVASAQTGVHADYNSTTHQITFSNVTGSNQYSQIALFDQMNALGQPVPLQAGTSPIPPGTAKNAAYAVNGVDSFSSTNSATYNGLTINLQSTTVSYANGGIPQDNPITLTVSDNTAAVVQSIQDFVTQYNKTVQTMQGLYYQKRYSDYKPLTTDQESQMTAKQIDQWNQKAQSGLLGNDSLLGSSLDDTISAAGGVVGGQPLSILNGQPVRMNSLSTIGIKFIDPVNGMDEGYTAPGVTSTGWNTFGLMEIDTNQLTQALQADPNSVMRMFTNNPTVPDGSPPSPEQGIAFRLADAISSSMSSIQTEAGLSTNLTPPTDSSGLLPATAIDPNGDFSALFDGDGSDLSSLGKSIKDLDDRATNMQQQLSDLQQRYKTQFSQMEQALASMNSQSSAFTSMLGQSSGG